MKYIPLGDQRRCAVYWPFARSQALALERQRANNQTLSRNLQLPDAKIIISLADDIKTVIIDCRTASYQIFSYQETPEYLSTRRLPNGTLRELNNALFDVEYPGTPTNLWYGRRHIVTAGIGPRYGFRELGIASTLNWTKARRPKVFTAGTVIEGAPGSEALAACVWNGYCVSVAPGPVIKRWPLDNPAAISEFPIIDYPSDVRRHDPAVNIEGENYGYWWINSAGTGAYGLMDSAFAGGSLQPKTWMFVSFFDGPSFRPFNVLDLKVEGIIAMDEDYFRGGITLMYSTFWRDRAALDEGEFDGVINGVPYLRSVIEVDNLRVDSSGSEVREKLFQQTALVRDDQSFTSWRNIPIAIDLRYGAMITRNDSVFYFNPPPSGPGISFDDAYNGSKFTCYYNWQPVLSDQYNAIPPEPVFQDPERIVGEPGVEFYRDESVDYDVNAQFAFAPRENKWGVSVVPYTRYGSGFTENWLGRSVALDGIFDGSNLIGTHRELLANQGYPASSGAASAPPHGPHTGSEFQDLRAYFSPAYNIDWKAFG